MSGYYGYSMSNNAVEAYDNGEKPFSKWSKKDILESCKELTTLDMSVLTVDELKDICLYESSYHHTSKFYNKTYFYCIDEDYIKNLTQEKINNIVNSRAKKTKRSKEEIQAEKEIKILNKAKKEYKKICKETGQNEHYINNVHIDKCELHEIVSQTILITDFYKQYKYGKDGYKTMRGYVNNKMKKINERRICNMESEKIVLTSCGEILKVTELELKSDDLGVFINCPFSDGCSGTCNIEVIE